MDSIEKAIRNAFAKGDPGNRAFREKVYRSAFGALDRALAANPNVTEAIAARRRQTLLAAVTAIETEFVPARAAAPNPQPTAPQVQVPLHDPPQSSAEAAPEIFVAGATPPPGGQVVAPTLDDDRRLGATPRQDKKQASGAGKAAAPQRATADRGPRRGRGFVTLIAGLMAIGGLAALWWFSPPSGEPATPSQAAGDAPPRLSGDAAALESWLDIFSPADPTTVAAPGDSRAEVMDSDDGQFLRIRSGTSGSPVLFDIGRGVLEQIAGRRTVFNIVARGADGQATQFSVDCSLDDLGDCGRKRYAAGATREDFLFEIELPAAKPDGGGVIAINSDVEGSGRSLDIFAIRVQPGQ